ncbi:MAG: hypothetical protein Q7T16_03685 [Candidatus Burarchaeum sp.]|nr:hypothetical protein [Candidatus Burarchaeum sp.]MDO8339733.1 hypothetical protein [Candidatus Burarchaeum sp.]
MSFKPQGTINATGNMTGAQPGPSARQPFLHRFLEFNPTLRRLVKDERGGIDLTPREPSEETKLAHRPTDEETKLAPRRHAEETSQKLTFLNKLENGLDPSEAMKNATGLGFLWESSKHIAKYTAVGVVSLGLGAVKLYGPFIGALSVIGGLVRSATLGMPLAEGMRDMFYFGVNVLAAITFLGAFAGAFGGFFMGLSNAMGIATERQFKRTGTPDGVSENDILKKEFDRSSRITKTWLTFVGGSLGYLLISAASVPTAVITAAVGAALGYGAALLMIRERRG